MQKFTSFKACIIASCLLSSAIPAYAGEAKQFKISQILAKLARKEVYNELTSPKGIAILTFLTSFFIFASRTPDNAPDRYNIEEVKANPTPTNVAKFAYYYLLDGIIGNARQSSTIKPGKDGSLEIKQAAPSRGLYGKVSDCVIPAERTLDFFGNVGSFITKIFQCLVAIEILEDLQ